MDLKKSQFEIHGAIWNTFLPLTFSSRASACAWWGRCFVSIAVACNCGPNESTGKRAVVTIPLVRGWHGLELPLTSAHSKILATLSAIPNTAEMFSPATLCAQIVKIIFDIVVCSLEWWIISTTTKHQNDDFFKNKNLLYVIVKVKNTKKNNKLLSKKRASLF
jgi:hypothetical protein